jgi:hypothetical protein
MSHESTHEENRRDHFRITDHAYVSYRNPENVPAAQPRRNSASFAALHDMMRDLYTQDRDLSRILSSVTEREHPLAGAFRIMNRKLDIMAQLIVLNQADLSDSKPVEVNLSEGGIALLTGEELLPQHEVYLQILLLPDMLPLMVRARVLDTEPCVGGFWTRFTFLLLTTEQKDLLARHILKAQQLNRRVTRQA